MKRFIPILLLGMVSIGWGNAFLSGLASNIKTNVTNFGTNLSSADNTVQKALDTLDEVAGGGAPEGTAVKSTGVAVGWVLQADGDNTSSWIALAGGGDALTANPLSQFAATTSLQLLGVMSDETGSGSLVFATSPTLVTPSLGTPSALVGTNISGTASGFNLSNISQVQDITATASEINTPLDGALVTLTEFQELETIGATTISAAQWTGLGGATTAGIALWDDASAAAQLITLGLTATASEINTPLDGASVTLTEFQELETIGATTISANQWALLGGLAETLTATEVNLLDGITVLSGSNTGDQTLRTGGRSITLNVNALDADAELYTDTKSLYIETPADADSFIFWKAPMALTITDIDCITDATSVVIDVQECTSAGASCATVDAAITCDADGAADDGTLSNGAIDSGDWVLLDIGTVTGSTWVAVTIKYTKDD